MFLKFQTAWCRSYLDSAVGLFDFGIIMNLDSVPPDCSTGVGCFFVTVPFSILEDEVEGVPLTIGSPGIAIATRSMQKAAIPCPPIFQFYGS